MKLKIQVKLLLYILSAALVVYIVSASYLNYHTNNTNTSLVIKNIRGVQNNAVLKIQNSLDRNIGALRSFASSLSGTNILSESERIEIYKTAAHVFLSNNSNYDNIKISWELGFIDAIWSKSYGRRVYTFERGDGSTRCTIEDLDKDGDDFSSS